MRCENVKDIETFSKSDPFVRIFRVSNMTNLNVPAEDLGDNDWREAHSTEHVNDNLNPKFLPFEISSASLCGGNPNAHIKFEIWDHSNKGEHKLIGKVCSSLAKIMSGQRQLDTFDMKRKPAGRIVFDNIFESV